MALTSTRPYKTRTAQRLNVELQQELLNVGRIAADRVVESMRKQAPKRNGFLRASIESDVTQLPDGNLLVSFRADTRTAGAKRDYAEAVEKGTRTPIHPKRSNKLALYKDLADLGVESRNAIIYRSSVRGQDAQPFFHHNVKRFDDIYQGLRRRRGLTGR